MDCRLLIADDEPDIVSMLASFFTGKGYQVLTAHSGAKTLKKIEQAPDLILLDINMPDMDGLEVCELIRGRVSCPILFLTARIEDADRVKGFSAGGDDTGVALPLHPGGGAAFLPEQAETASGRAAAGIGKDLPKRPELYNFV